MSGVHVELFELDVVSGRRSGLAARAQQALKALNKARVPYAVIGATALAARGLPRMTKDVDIVVNIEDAYRTLDVLSATGFHSVNPVDRAEEPEPMYVLESRRPVCEIDVLVAAGEPESTVVSEAPAARVFGIKAPVATLEHLALMYLYSNQPRHLGDFARVVTETDVDLQAVERFLLDVHPEMLPVLRERVRLAEAPPPEPKRPPRRRR